MPVCENIDCCEKLSLGLPSPGKVTDDERLIRGAYEGSHYNSGLTKLRDAFPRERDILTRQLSVWRLDRGFAGNSAHAFALVKDHGPSDKILHECIILATDYLRSIETINGERALCVADDTEIDTACNRHPDHATVGLCRSLSQENYVEKSEASIYVVRQLTAYANLQKSKGLIIRG